jgi:hypothetical protein
MVDARKRRLELMIDVWRRLRRPFILPVGARHHACEWEAIDIDVLGCLVCGSIHACDVCTCAEVIETNDSVVCAISGAVLRNQMYSQVEFVDTVAMTGPVSQFEEDFTAEVEQTVEHMLLSASSQRQRRAALCDVLLRWTRAGAAGGAAAAPAQSLLAACAALARKAEHLPHAFAFVSAPRRHALAAAAKEDCRRILRFMVTCGMPVKAAEAPRLTVGLLYLMRHGIRNAEQVVLQKRSEIAQILPAESMLSKHYGIHPKFITETENRIKFCLRLKLV